MAPGLERVEDALEEPSDRIREKGKSIRLRLLRLPRGLTAELVVDFRIGDEPTFFGLTTGRDGTLVLSVGWSHRHVIAALRLEPDGTLSLAGAWRGGTALALAAYRGLDDTFLVPPTATGTGLLRPIALSKSPAEKVDVHPDDARPMAKRLEELFE